MRPKLTYQTPAYLHAEIAVELGFLSCLHVELGYAYRLTSPTLPFDREGYRIDSISSHGLSVRVILGWSFYYPDPEF